MSFEYTQKIPSVKELIAEVPLRNDLKKLKQKRDRELINIFTGKSNKFLLIIGPCSADNEDAVCEYVTRLAELNEKVGDQLLLVPRIYTNKPRTTGEGYKGMAHQPNPSEAPNIVEGLKAIRRMHVRVLKESGLTAADEMLYPGNYPLLEDLLSYVAIGARSVENQQHRLTVSGLDVPIGMKNPTSGDLNVLFNSVQAAQAPHTFIYNGWEVKTPGNSLAHCILRGSVNHLGENIPNYHFEDLKSLSAKYQERSLQNPVVIVDVSHANSKKMFREQPRVAKEVMQIVQKSDVMKGLIKGLMIESYLIEGAQGPGESVYGKSITDACLGWEDSEKLVLELADFVCKL